MALVERPGFEELRAEYSTVLLRAIETEDYSGATSGVGPGSGLEKRAALEQAFRDSLPPLLTAGATIGALERHLSACTAAARAGATAAALPVVLLGDAFDALTLERCEQLFAFVEGGVAVWKEEAFFGACKNNLLRMCNDLLRRLSRSQNTVFCGRILLFLAKFFPFSERSGLNIVSEFNWDGATEGVGAETGEAEPPEAAEEGRARLAVDYNLYCKFWALQDFFRNPNLCYNRVQWKTLTSHASSVLGAFGSFKLEAAQAPGARRAPDQETHYFAKFLTNQKLLELQLSDSNFRRCVLVQFLILFQYLNSSVKFKMELELKAEQAEWVSEQTAGVLRLLGETPPRGRSFAACVQHILHREEHWNNWKNDGCPEFQKLKAPLAEVGAAGAAGAAGAVEERRLLKPRRKRLLGDIVKDYEAQGKFYLGNSELTKLWNLCPDNLEACRGKERDFLPSLESYLSEAMAQAAQGETRAVADGSFGWRALRLLARRSPHFFTHSNNPINRLPDYLDIMVRKVAKDLPSAKQESVEEEVSEEQMEADLMKGGETCDVDQPIGGTDMTLGEEPPRPRPTPASPAQLAALCAMLGEDWQRLAAKLSYAPDEVLFFETSHASPSLRASALLQHWFEDDEDASAEALAYILEGLGLARAAEALKLAE